MNKYRGNASTTCGHDKLFDVWKYEGDAPDGTDSIKITFGHAKDNRMDLKRVRSGNGRESTWNPLFMQSFSETNLIKKFCQRLNPETERVHFLR